MGGANAGWAYNEGVPLCQTHHDELDARGNWKLHLETQRIVRLLAPRFWERMKAELTAKPYKAQMDAGTVGQ
jgi:hypothetical protein